MTFHYRCPLCNELMTVDKRKTHHLHCAAVIKPRESNCAYTRLCRKHGIKGF